MTIHFWADIKIILLAFTTVSTQLVTFEYRHSSLPKSEYLSIIKPVSNKKDTFYSLSFELDSDKNAIL